MSRLQLPTTGAANWGSGLNAYIRHLETRIQNVEQKIGDTTISDVVQNVAGACTGVISNFNVNFQESSRTLKFSGTVYYAGGIRKVIDVKSEISYTISDDYNSSDIGYFVYLNYNSSSSSLDEVGRLEFVLDPELILSYQRILLGFYCNNKFVPYFYWDMKTVTQHQYELTHPYNDLDENYITIQISSGLVNTINIGPKTCNVYCGGLGQTEGDVFTSSEVAPYSLTILEPSATSNPLIYLEDELEDGELITKHVTSAPAVNNTVDNRGNYYRILVDIFGRTYVQKAAKKNDINVASYGAEQTLLNVRFGRKFFQSSSLGYSYSYQSNLLMEVGRFAYNGAVSTTYANSIEGSNIIFNNSAEMIYTRSAWDGVGSQPFLGVWDLKEGYLFLDKLKFLKSEEDNTYDFKINYVSDVFKNSAGTTEGLQEITFAYPFTAATLNNIDPSIYSITDFTVQGDLFKFLEFKTNVYQVRIKLGAQYYLIEKDKIIDVNTEVSYPTYTYTIDSGLASVTIAPKKYDSHIGVDFTYSISGEADLTALKNILIDIIYVNEVSLYLKNNMAVEANPTFMWTKMNTGSDAILLMNNNSQLIMPAVDTQPLTIKGNGLLLQDGDKDVLRSSKLGGSTLTLYSDLYDSDDKTAKVEHVFKMDTDAAPGRSSTYQINHYSQVDPLSDFDIANTVIESKWIMEDTGGSSPQYLTLSFTADKINVNGTIYMAENEQMMYVSDARRKENFETLNQSYLDVVNKVPVFKYNYKNSNKNQIGIIAQDLEKALENYKECFISVQDTTELENQRSLNENKLIFILWKALQEETILRQNLEKRLETLESNF